jgi:hypothetical protein
MPQRVVILVRTAALAALVASTSAVVGGCAQGGAQSLLPQIGQTAPDKFNPGQPFQLSAEELALDCRKLSGRMQIRILQARDASVRGGGSTVARTIQSAVTPVSGGTTQGANASYDAARDRAVLEAMNRQLAAKNCATYDLDAELRPRPSRDTPTPVPKAEPAPRKAG